MKFKIAILERISVLLEKNDIRDWDQSKLQLITKLWKLTTYRGSYMSAHVLLILLNELGKRYKMRGFPSILSLFRNEFNKINNTRAQMLDSIYHMT